MTRLLSHYLPHYRALLSLGMPIVVGQLGVIVLGFADTLMIGHHSTPGLAAASFVNNMFNLCIIFSTGFSYGLTPIVGGLYGRSRLAEAGLALRCSLAANTAVAVLQMLVMGILYLCLDLTTWCCLPRCPSSCCSTASSSLPTALRRPARPCGCCWGAMP